MAVRQNSTHTDDVMIELAKKEWEIAENFFNEVTDPDMAEFAILQLSAAMKKYEYLFKKRKVAGRL